MKLEHKRFQERRIEGPARALTRVFVDLKASPEKEKLRLSTTIESVEFQTNTRPRAAAGPSIPLRDRFCRLRDLRVRRAGFWRFAL